MVLNKQKIKNDKEKTFKFQTKIKNTILRILLNNKYKKLKNRNE